MREESVPEVSVIIPVYNKADYVVPCVDSVLAQTMADQIEVILMDDCSTDGSLELLRKTYGKHPKVRILQNEKNSGAGMTRKFALEHARGEKIAFIDADDTVEPEYLHRMYEAMKATQADMVDEGRPDFWRKGNKGMVLPSNGAERLLLLRYFLINTNMVQQMTTRSLLERCSKYFTGMRFFEDAFLGVVLLCLAERYVVIPGTLYHVVSTPDSVTRGDLLDKVPDYVENTLEVFRRFLDFQKETPSLQANGEAISVVYSYFLNLSVDVLFKPVFQQYPPWEVNGKIHETLRKHFSESEAVYIQLLLNKVCMEQGKQYGKDLGDK